MTQLTLDAAEGQRLKRKGQETVAAKNGEWLAVARALARVHSCVYGHVTTDDVRLQMASRGMYPTHHNCYGTVFKGNGWTVVGRQPSTLAGNRGREIKVWRWEGA